MAIIQTLFAALARQAGRLINTIFGWATTTLFGKVPQERQTLLSVIALGSIAWFIVLIGVIVPRAGVFLLSLVRLPPWVNDNLVRLAMLAAAAVLPLVIGFVGIKILDPEDRLQGKAATLKRILHGYPYALAVSLALVMMIVFVPILKVQTMRKRWTSEHLPMVVEEQDYAGTVRDVQQALDKAGYDVAPRQASILLRLPLKVMTALAGRGQGNLVADNLTTLESDKLQLILHPADLVINGRKYDAAHARAVVAEQLAFSKAYLTWTKEANEMEDRLREIWQELRARANGSVPPATAARLADFERDLSAAKIGHEEWEVLFRDTLLVERGLLQVEAGLVDRPRQPDEVDIRELGAQKAAAGAPGAGLPQRPPVLGLALRVLPLLGVAAMAWFVRGRQDAAQDYAAQDYTPQDYAAYDFEPPRS
jgi:hypothetical protein